MQYDARCGVCYAQTSIVAGSIVFNLFGFLNFSLRGGVGGGGVGPGGGGGITPAQVGETPGARQKSSPPMWGKAGMRKNAIPAQVEKKPG